MQGMIAKHGSRSWLADAGQVTPGDLVEGAANPVFDCAPHRLTVWSQALSRSHGRLD